MLDIGGWEFLVVAFVLIMVVGPKELPAMLRSFTRFMQRVRSMASEFSRGIQDMADDADLGDVKSTIADVKRGNLSGIADGLDPDGALKDSVDEMRQAANRDAVENDVNEIRDMASSAGTQMANEANRAPAGKSSKVKAKPKAVSKAAKAS